MVELTQGLLQLQAWVSTKWSSINSFFSVILIFHKYSVSKIHFYHTIPQDSIRRLRPGAVEGRGCPLIQNYTKMCNIRAQVSV